MYKSILVPLDGSKRAEAILPHVENLAHHYEAEVIFMGVIEPEAAIVMAEPYYASFDEGRYTRLVSEVSTYLDARCGEFREMGIKAKPEVSQGPIVESIIRVAEREDSDLIAMASHGRTGLPQVFYGSVAAGVLHRATRPLLLIRAVDR